jgi:hypothetical protein
MKKLTILFTLLIIGGASWYFFSKQISSEGVMCTADAKICPDGTGVGRIGPKCEFAPCPIVKETTKARIVETILNNGLYITPQDVVSDSRCPIDVTCVWAGEIKVRVTVRRSEDYPIETKDITLKIGEVVSYKNKSIELVSVLPVPNSKSPVEMQYRDYVFEFRVK